MFQLSDQRVDIPISKLKDEVPTTLLCGGIVNPLGPSLSAMVLLGEAKPGHTLQLVEVMLNPFAQEAHRIGSATIPQGGDGAQLTTMHRFLRFLACVAVRRCFYEVYG